MYIAVQEFQLKSRNKSISLRGEHKFLIKMFLTIMLEISVYQFVITFILHEFKSLSFICYRFYKVSLEIFVNIHIIFTYYLEFVRDLIFQ